MTKSEFVSKKDEYIQYLKNEEKSDSTIKKYRLGIEKFEKYAESNNWKKALKDSMIEYKMYLKGKYELSTANLYIIALNKYLKYLKKPHLCINTFKLQEQKSLENSLTMAEYTQMADVSKPLEKNDIYYVRKAIVITGIRISELKFFTVNALREKKCQISNKGKTRYIVLTEEICTELLDYCNRKGIIEGIVFHGRNTQKCICRSTITRRMKKIAKLANVKEEKAFPHNLRHLFAKRYMEVVGNITGLQNILGHSSIKATMIYTCTTNDEKRKDLVKLGFQNI